MPSRSRNCACFTAPRERSSASAALRGHDPGEEHLDLGALARFAIETEPATQAICDDVVDDVQSEPGAAEIAPRREKRIEGLMPDVEAHATAVVAEEHFHVIIAGRPHLDLDAACLAVRKCMGDRIKKQVG